MLGMITQESVVNLTEFFSHGKFSTIDAEIAWTGLRTHESATYDNPECTEIDRTRLSAVVDVTWYDFEGAHSFKRLLRGGDAIDYLEAWGWEYAEPEIEDWETADGDEG